MSWSYKYDEARGSGIIRMTRADTPEFEVHAWITNPETGEQYEFIPDPEKGENITFAVKLDPQDDGPLFFIHTDENGIIHFKPQYTRELKQKKYLYELSVNIPPTEEADSFHCTFATGYLILDTEIYYDIDSGPEY